MATFKKYRIFSQDVGRAGYSGVKDVRAMCARDAVRSIPPAWNGEKMLALPHSRMDLWPDGKTGRVSPEAFQVGATN